MYDQCDRTIVDFRDQGDTYFSFTKPLQGYPENEFLRVYERNTRAVAGAVAQWLPNSRVPVVLVGIAGEIKYPPTTERIDEKTYRLWADYKPSVIAVLQEYLKTKYNNNFNNFLNANNIPQGTFTSFNDINPPRSYACGTTNGCRNADCRGTWDILGDPNNPFFMEWFNFRVDEVKKHIEENARRVKEEGVIENSDLKIYSNQALFGEAEEGKDKYYWHA